VLLSVKAPCEVFDIIEINFLSDREMGSFCNETIDLGCALGRVLTDDIIACEDVPGFNRSTVDGYAVKASDTFGCSESIPAVLTLTGEVLMGESAGYLLNKGACVSVSTGGEVPEGADAVVMHEFTEDYGNNMVGIQKPVAPGSNIIFRDDDAASGDVVLTGGTIIAPHDIGILSALGYERVEVRRKPVVGIISTGDELVGAASVLKSGQIRDVNSPMLYASVVSYGAYAKSFGVIKDDEAAIRAAMLEAIDSCDIVLISGGSSAGTRDMTAKVIESEGEMLLHGIAMKPGKPTILGIVFSKPVFGLPGHPVAAYMVTELFVRPLIKELLGVKDKRKTVKAKLSESISSNHGREEYVFVRFGEAGGLAHPVKGKSGLIAGLAGVNGYICIPRDSEGVAGDDEVEVICF